MQYLMEIGLPIAIILIMIGLGLSLAPNDFKRVFKQPKSFILGVICQMLFLPLIAILIISLTGLTGELAIGLFILSLCPGGATSNLFSYLAKADVGLSVSLTAVVGFITPFTIPFLTAWAINYYGENQEAIKFPVLMTWVKLMVITVIPILIGMFIRSKKQSLAIKAQPFINWFSISVLVLVIIAICSKMGSKIMEFTILAGPAVILLNITTMIFAFYIGKVFLDNHAQSRTLTLEVGLQNGTLALLITSTILQSNTMSIPPSIYGLFMFLTAGIFSITMLKKDKLIIKTKQ
ncbi:bile acid:sodium symporter family protein [Pseudoalteromonas sp. C2R02]|uniref:bile acid:sodium symporter family protein n=1 Tax=Pseudoalteromonas sp. C2R02 TaxID=2841565 RepID=UPI001C098AEA|nr:bile acid:sodium symporter family protein [Pseudoalteromonas sp. C2R02]MBU2970905.1 bile acid:sodium symporter family protein [Pseudoalteromonas sp. C2R02]